MSSRPAALTTPSRTVSFAHIDMAGFARELEQLRANLDAERGPADYRHLRTMERLGRLFFWAGLAMAPFALNPLAIFLISFATVIRWAMITHHISHRGYDKIPGIAPRYTSKGYARGWRRYLDWFDWMHPEAWNQEHNIFHHYYTSEIEDPDLVEQNVMMIRDYAGPRLVKFMFMLFMACTWKFSYYAPKTLMIWQRVRARQRLDVAQRGKLRNVMPSDPQLDVSYLRMYSPLHRDGRELWLKCLLPYATLRFVVLPAAFLPLGLSAALTVLATLLLAELATNIHSFIVIVTNHAGDDLYRFHAPLQDRNEFYVRQVISSVNFRTGGNLNDMLHGWLNYQIEHHIWPDMTMLQYQKAQPQVQAICAKYGVPYVQQSVWRRLPKLWSIIAGDSSMPAADTSPAMSTQPSAA